MIRCEQHRLKFPDNSWSFTAIYVQKQKFYGGKEYEEFFYPFLKRSGVFMLVIELG